MLLFISHVIDPYRNIFYLCFSYLKYQISNLIFWFQSNIGVQALLNYII